MFRNEQKWIEIEKKANERVECHFAGRVREPHWALKSSWNLEWKNIIFFLSIFSHFSLLWLAHAQALNAL